MVQIWIPEWHHLSLTSISTLSCWPLLSGHDHPTNFSSTKQSTPQISISPSQRDGCCGGLCQRPYRFQTDDIHGFFLVHWDRHSIIQGHWVVQAGLALGKTVLAVLNFVPVLHLPQDILKEDLFHDLPRHRGESDRLVVPRVLLSTFLKNACNASLFPVISYSS